MRSSASHILAAARSSVPYSRFLVRSCADRLSELRDALLNLGLILFLCLPSFALRAGEDDDLLSLSWEELNAQEIGTLTRKRAPLSESPVAAFVITAEDIRRSGARTLPDILRMAPGIQVASAGGWNQVVTARGMNGFYANKLLAMIDGRSIYDPFISGVWWGDQNPFLEDIERIEILRGPGGSLWGANAFNGVINIVTKRGSDTQGGLAVAGGGTEERIFGGARYGFRLGESTYGRVFANGQERDSTARVGGGDANDGQRAQHGGFRIDSRLTERDRLTVQGDAFHNRDAWYTRGTQATPPFDVLGNHTTVNLASNLLSRWRHAQADGGEWTLGAYLDYMRRDWPIVGEEQLTLDLDFQQRLAPFGRHEWMWGAGYRHIRDSFANNPLLFSMNPDRYRQNNFSVFFQDEISLVPKKLTLTLGSKFEHYTLAGFQAEPNIRLSWTPSKTHNVWLAVSRAIALPNRYQRDFKLITPIGFLPDGTPYINRLPDGSPIFGQFCGSRDLDVETVIAYELGWRYAPSSRLKFDLSLFYNHYEDLIVGVGAGRVAQLPGTRYLVGIAPYRNAMDVDSYGLEISADYATFNNLWRWHLAYTFMGMDEDSRRHADIARLLQYQHTQPHHTISLRSSIDLRDDLELDVWLRHAGSVNPTGKPIPAYLTLDARIGWQLSPNLEISLVGRNLLDGKHPEFANNFYLPYLSEIERSVYVKASVRF